MYDVVLVFCLLCFWIVVDILQIGSLYCKVRTFRDIWDMRMVKYVKAKESERKRKKAEILSLFVVYVSDL